MSEIHKKSQICLHKDKTQNSLGIANHGREGLQTRKGQRITNQGRGIQTRAGQGIINWGKKITN